MILTSLFADLETNANGANGAFHGNPTLLGKHVAVLVCVFVAVTFGSWVITKVVGVVVGFRVTGEAEEHGLDWSQHEESILDVENLATLYATTPAQVLLQSAWDASATSSIEM